MEGRMKGVVAWALAVFGRTLDYHEGLRRMNTDEFISSVPWYVYLWQAAWGNPCTIVCPRARDTLIRAHVHLLARGKGRGEPCC
jgi:hypothetical protein